MRRLIAFPSILVLVIHSAIAQTKTQSIIYDATTLMNAMHGINALLIPTAVDFDIQDPLTGNTIDHSLDGNEPAFMLNRKLLDSTIFSILRRNAGLADDAPGSEVISAYSANPFLKDFFTKNAEDGFLKIETDGKAKGMDKVAGFVVPPGVGSIGNNILGNLVNGTADFLIKRAQEEISISVFEKLKQFITRYPEFDTLFPKTCALIKPVEAYEYSKALDAFKAAIKEDLKEFISRIPLLYDIPRYNLLNKRISSLSFVFAASSLYADLHEKAGAAECMYHLGKQSFVEEKNNYAVFIKVVTLLSNSLLDKKLGDEDSKPISYIHKEYIGLVTHHDPLLLADLAKMYLGLLWQHTYTISFVVDGAVKNFGELLEHWNNKDRVGNALKTIDISLNAIVKADEELTKLKKQEYDESQLTGKYEIKAQRFKVYARLTNDLMGITEIYLDPASNLFSLRNKQIRQYFPEFASNVIDMTRYFAEEEYSLGISKLAEVLKTVSDYLDRVEYDKVKYKELASAMEKRLETDHKKLEADRKNLANRIDALNRMTTSADIEAEKQELLTAVEIIDQQIRQNDYQKNNLGKVIFKLSKVIDYMNLLAAITKAENSVAVERLLETYALPAGSSRIKKASQVNFAVNAYIGGFFARSKQEGEGFTNTYGFTAPIGLTLSSGLQRGGSVSLFAGVFDIGGVVKYKLNNQGKYEQDISLAGIVSPSVHLVYGFPFYLPFSAGAGWQWISPVVAGSNKIDLKPSFNAFVAVDIPLFNLANASRKRKL